MGAICSNQRPQEAQVFISGLNMVYPSALVDEKFMSKVMSGKMVEGDDLLLKLRAINKRTGIKSRPVILDSEDPFYHCAEPMKVEDLTKTWLDHGIPLCHDACLGAIADWGGSLGDITHLIAATCSVQTHPGIDAYIAESLRLSSRVSRTLLSGVGCAGAAALLSVAHELAMAMTCRGKPARILVVSCDINSLGFRSEVERLKEGEFPIGLTLFSDAAAAAVVTNGIGTDTLQTGSYSFEILDWKQYTIPNSLSELQLMPTSIGPVSIISKNLPDLIAFAVRDLFYEKISSMPTLVGSDGKIYQEPADFDWDIHPGGFKILDRIVEIVGLTHDNTTATLITYGNWGNSAGPTVLKVLDVRRSFPIKREYSVCCGFGNNVNVTMLILRRF